MSDNKNLREELADVQHAIWAHWMQYMFSCGTFDEQGNWIMPWDKARRWQRQMDTPYAELTDKERESDRDQADKVLAVLPAVSDIPALLAEIAQLRFIVTEYREGMHEAKGALNAEKHRADVAEQELERLRQVDRPKPKPAQPSKADISRG